MSATLPAALALAGTALTAITIFAPFRPSPPVTNRRTILPVAAEAEPYEPSASTPSVPGDAAAWTERVDPAARACDASARADLAEALGTLQTPWALALLRYAGEVESDPLVRSAIAAALSVSSSQSLVT